MNREKWDAEASEIADHVHAHMGEAHRGTMPWHQAGICVAFGNDGYCGADGMAVDEVDALRSHIETQGWVELGFGLNAAGERGYTWVMLVKTTDAEELNSLVWDAWREVSPDSPIKAMHEQSQRAIALGPIDRAAPRIDHESN